jgi:hypothetical protein
LCLTARVTALRMFQADRGDPIFLVALQSLKRFDEGSIVAPVSFRRWAHRVIFAICPLPVLAGADTVVSEFDLLANLVGGPRRGAGRVLAVERPLDRARERSRPSGLRSLG